jgi:DNA-binding beta-propeller fold protein YncE
LSALQSLAVDPNTGNVLACDDGSYSVQIYSPAGVLLGSAGSYGYGTANAQFGAASPSGAAVDSGGNFYLVDYALDEIKVFAP